MKGKAIVYVVDDDDVVRSALARLLRSANFEVATFPSAENFLECRLPDRPACLVLDVLMPGQNGLELQRELDRSDIDIPVVFLSGFGDVPTSVRAMKKGAVDFLEKPVDDEELLGAIRKALDRHRESRSWRTKQASIQHRVDTLTRREKEVLALVVQGLANKEIGTRLGTTEKTVKVHRGRMMRKMQAPSLAELVKLASRVEIRK